MAAVASLLTVVVLVGGIFLLIAVPISARQRRQLAAVRRRYPGAAAWLVAATRAHSSVLLVDDRRLELVRLDGSPERAWQRSALVGVEPAKVPNGPIAKPGLRLTFAAGSEPRTVELVVPGRLGMWVSAAETQAVRDACTSR